MKDQLQGISRRVVQRSYLAAHNCRLELPLCHPFVKATLEGMQRSLAKSTIKKEPVTMNMLEAIVKDADKSGSLTDLRLALLGQETSHA